MWMPLAWLTTDTTEHSSALRSACNAAMAAAYPETCAAVGCSGSVGGLANTRSANMVGGTKQTRVSTCAGAYWRTKSATSSRRPHTAKSATLGTNSVAVYAVAVRPAPGAL